MVHYSKASGGRPAGSAKPNGSSPAANLRQTATAAQPDVVEALTRLGFNLNEGRAYATLLRLGPCTGYEVSRRAAIPRSAVYNALRRLVSSGAARSVGSDPERFVATPVEALLELLAKRFEASGEDLRSAIEQMDVHPTEPDAFSVRGYSRILEEAARLINGAAGTLILSGWPRELRTLTKELANAQQRGVYTVIFSHARLPDDLAGIHFSYSLAEQDLEAFWRHRLVLVADERQTLLAATEGSRDDTAMLSEAAAIAEFATGQIALDVTLLAQRHDHDVSEVMAKVLGDRVGRLDELLASGVEPVLAREHGDKAQRRQRRARG